MIRKQKTKSALPWFGSDSEVAADLALLLDHCSHVTIPFCGGLAILPHLTARAIVANDLHSLAICFYRTLSGAYGQSAAMELIDRCASTLSHPAELDLAKGLAELDNPVDRAWACWATCWIGRKGKGGTKHSGGMPSIRRTASGGTNASRIAAAANDLPLWAEQFRRCEWEQRDFREVLDSVADKPDCGIYLDPPWRTSGRNYLHSFTDSDHADLAERLRRFDAATWVLRINNDPVIRNLYHDATVIESESRTQSNAVKGELWITNLRDSQLIEVA